MWRWTFVTALILAACGSADAEPIAPAVPIAPSEPACVAPDLSEPSPPRERARLDRCESDQQPALVASCYRLEAARASRTERYGRCVDYALRSVDTAPKTARSTQALYLAAGCYHVLQEWREAAALYDRIARSTDHSFLHSSALDWVVKLRVAMPRLVLRAPDRALRGLRVYVDGELWPHFDKSMPIDPGAHVITGSACLHGMPWSYQRELATHPGKEHTIALTQDLPGQQP